jgi:hypothetical protein
MFTATNIYKILENVNPKEGNELTISYSSIVF